MVQMRGHNICKPFEDNVVYVPITASSHKASMISKQTMALYNLIGCWRCSIVRSNTACKCFTTTILGAYNNKVFRQCFD